MKVGMIGYGAWGGIHAGAIAALDSHELAVIACKSQASAERARTDYPDVAVTTDYAEILARRDIDVVDVVVPTHLHVPFAIEALEAGKHVLVEKPVAGSLEEGERLLAAARKSDRVVSLVHELRSSEQWAGVKRAIDAGEIGAPGYAMLNLFRFPYRLGAESWRYDRSTVGSWVLEEPIHFIDLLLWYFESLGAPTHVTAFMNEAEAGSGLSRDFTAVFQFAERGYGVISQTLSAFEHHQVVEVTGSDGAIRSLWSGAMDRTDRPEFSLTIKGKDDAAPRQFPFSAPSGELFEIREYIGEILDNMERKAALYPLESELELVRLCLAAEQSAREGRTVELQ